jgi:hypothetical protein
MQNKDIEEVVFCPMSDEERKIKTEIGVLYIYFHSESPF